MEQNKDYKWDNPKNIKVYGKQLESFKRLKRKRYEDQKARGREYNPNYEGCKAICTRKWQSSYMQPCKNMGWKKLQGEWRCYKHRNQTKEERDLHKVSSDYDKELKEIEKMLS